MSDEQHPLAIDNLRRQLLKAGGIALGTLPLGATTALATTSNRQIIARKLHKETDLPLAYIEEMLAKARFDPSVIKRIKTPYESKPYVEYRPLFVHDKLIEKGSAFIRKHQKIFDRCQEKYGVQPQLISAILGMETRYGNYRGKDRVLDALYTLAAGYPRRADFFRRELGEFLQLCREEKLDPAAIQGSYAGAFGTTQFIPSSYRGYAVDADGDGKRDVWNSPEDIICSVANYFHRYRWDASRPVALWLKKMPTAFRAKLILKEETRKWHRLGDVQDSLGQKLPDIWHADDKVTLIQRMTAKGKRTALVHYNFHVITRWNRSYNYALAATELSYAMGCSLCGVES